jgi:hypothetical protein
MWWIFESADGGLSYFVFDEVVGAQRSELGMDVGNLAYVQAYDLIGNPVGIASNIVTVL